ncbi:acyl-CoA thioesterase domain-containing protein [Mycolicibacterium thermoresistibile]
MSTVDEMSERPAYFIAIDGGYQPTSIAQSYWGDDHLSGAAVVGLAALCLERECGAPEFHPSRLTVDLFRPARGVPTSVRVRVVRDGHRVRSAECDVVQNGRTVARANLLQYRRSAAPPGELWCPTKEFSFPSGAEEVRAQIGSEAADWTPTVGAHQNGSRKKYFAHSIDVVSGHRNSPLVRGVVVAEATSFVTNLGTRGVGYINGDLTVGLSRLPVGELIGVQADSHVAHDGVAVGVTSLFDTAGMFGTGMITAVSNPAAQIQFSRRGAFERD